MPGYPSTVDAGSSPAACQALEPTLPKPLSDDDVLAQFVGLGATRHARACSDRDFHPCDPVGPNDCQPPGWDKTWSAPLRRRDLSVFQRYWTLLPAPGGGRQCRFVGEVRVVVSRCAMARDGERGTEQSIDARELPNAVDLVTGQALRAEPSNAVGTANHWKE